MKNKIAILGDFNPKYRTLHQLNDSTRHVQQFLNTTIQFDWIPTDLFDNRVVFERYQYNGLWIAPGSPYKDMDNVLHAIRYTRENNIPTLGNCGGFQHMLIEFANNVCGIENAIHEEVKPGHAEPLIKRLSCSLVGEQEKLNIINDSSILYRSYGLSEILGKYYCSYGLNETYADQLVAKGLLFTSMSEDGQYRSFEIMDHPFFVGTLFQPALASSYEDQNPIIVDFVKASLIHNRGT